VAQLRFRGGLVELDELLWGYSYESENGYSNFYVVCSRFAEINMRNMCGIELFFVR